MIYDVFVIGGGPAGLAAAIAAAKESKKVLLVEREARLGGILKQCIHDGFGLMRFGEKLSGPEYAERYIEEFKQMKIPYMTLTFVTGIEKKKGGFIVHMVNRDGVSHIKTRTIILATGCRERTARQVSIHGTRPAGIYTAGTAQNFTNLMGLMPAKRCVILGSGDIGLIMARRLTLEGAEVVGVYEAKPEPSGLTRNIVQCLEDFNIPLHLSHTVTKVYGNERVTGVQVCAVDETMTPIEGTEEDIACDTLVLSVGLIPENEIAEELGVDMDRVTKGPVCDASMMTNIPGVFSCGNALHVNDLVDYVSESGESAGKAAVRFALDRKWQQLEQPDDILVAGNEEIAYIIPQKLSRSHSQEKNIFYFRCRRTMKKSRLCIYADEDKIYEKTYMAMRPPEMERLVLDIDKFMDQAGIKRETVREISFKLEACEA